MIDNVGNKIINHPWLGMLAIPPIYRDSGDGLW